MAQTVKRLPTMRETRVQSLGREDFLEKEMATHSSYHSSFISLIISDQSVVPYRVLTVASQEAGKMVWYSHPFKSFPFCCDPHSQRL